MDLENEFAENENPKFLILENREFYNQKEMIFDIGPGIPWKKDIFNPYPKLNNIKIINCVFTNCKVISSFSIRKGVEIKNVIFDNIRCSDVLTISTSALLNNLVIKGKAGLWIKPDYSRKDDEVENEYNEHISNWLAIEQIKIHCMLNILELDSDEVEILGIPINKILYNRERYLPIYREWNDFIDWKSSRISSYWRICIRRLKDFDVPYGLISIPSKKHKDYFEEMNGLDYLKEIGLIKQHS